MTEPAPPDYDTHLVQLRRRFGLSQAELAERIGAASKAVVYQWESRKRRPSQVLWRRVLVLDFGIAGLAGVAPKGST